MEAWVCWRPAGDLDIWWEDFIEEEWVVQLLVSGGKGLPRSCLGPYFKGNHVCEGADTDVSAAASRVAHLLGWHARSNEACFLQGAKQMSLDCRNAQVSIYHFLLYLIVGYVESETERRHLVGGVKRKGTCFWLIKLGRQASVLPAHVHETKRNISICEAVIIEYLLPLCSGVWRQDSGRCGDGLLRWGSSCILFTIFGELPQINGKLSRSDL